MLWWRLGVPLVALSCGDQFAPSPFRTDTLPDAGGVGGETGDVDAGSRTPPLSTPTELLGGPCVDDAQCDDGIDCTFGSCDTALGLCRFVADDERCSDGLFCNGAERCDPRVGCRPGPPTSCSDSTPCTIDTCDEATRACVRVQRDVDGDGSVDANCQPGGDCNDLDPLVASSAPELCGNLRDEDCDGEIDEGDCQLPEFDTCAASLAVDAAGSYMLSPAGAQLDYGAACAADGATLRELVVSIAVPAPGQDVELVARSQFGNLALSRPSTCGSEPSAEQCVRGALLGAGDGAVRLHLYSPPSGVQPIYVYTDTNAPIQLDVSYEAPSIDPGNLSCDARVELEAGTPIDVDLAVPSNELETECGTPAGDRYFEISLAQPSDVLLAAQSLDGLGQPRLSLRTDACVGQSEELRCNQRPLAALRARSLPAGDYVVALSASGPTRARLTLDVRPPTDAPAGDRCDGAPALVANRTLVVDFQELDDDIAAGCSPGAVDGARQLRLDAASDVLLVARFSPGDVGAVALASPGCTEPDTLACTRGTDALSRVSRRGVAAGDYRVLTESSLGLPATVLAAVRPASAPTLVPGSEACPDAVTIDPNGGLYQGNTANAAPDLTASCDFATPTGAPDQLLRLVLPEPRRVVFDMRGSDFETLLDVRQGPDCPGTELVNGCAVFVGGDRSFLDLNLPAGEYFVQIDGYAGASGNWFLNVFVLDP